MNHKRAPQETPTSIGKYHIGEVLGKGAFGTVFRALNIENGVTVAIKRVSNQDLDDEKLESIESEVKLLKRLKHANIVQYMETVREADGSLNIILEYIENGSLSTILKKFGVRFPESLVAIYTTQVLLGLSYLHAQGVVHRDIKGANILATKDGHIKLADFGVASDQDDSDGIVGTPYWMAPEIIEMSGHRGTACDVWSVGCTVIELLTGCPPYFELSPMPALFRIVSDDHPPLPENLSQPAKDFLLACFQKDPNLRISADKLLEHRWLKAPASLELAPVSKHNKADVDAAAAHDVVQQTVKLYKENIETMLRDRRPSGTHRASVAAIFGATTSSANPPAVVAEDDEDMSSFDVPDVSVAKPAAGPKLIQVPKPAALATPAVVVSEPLKIAVGKEQYDSDPFDSSSEDDSIPVISASTGPKLIQLPKPNVPAPVVSQPLKIAVGNQEYESDPFGDSDDDAPQPARQSAVSNTVRLVAPAIPAGAGSNSNSIKLRSITSFASLDSGSTPPSSGLTTPADTFTRALRAKSMGAVSGLPNNASSTTGSRTKSFTESERDETFDDFDSFEFDAARALAQKKQAAWDKTPAAENTVTSESGASAGLMDLDDIVDDDRVIAKRRLVADATRALKALSASLDAVKLVELVSKLVDLHAQEPKAVAREASQCGVLPIMEVLETCSPEALAVAPLLRLVSGMCEGSHKLSEALCLVGLIPAVLRLCTHAATRHDAAALVRHFCGASDFTRKMFIACGGLSVLVTLLEHSANNTTEPLDEFGRIAIDCIYLVFQTSTNPKNDFYRLFCKFGLLKPLCASYRRIVLALSSSAPPPSPDTTSTSSHQSNTTQFDSKIAKLLHMFAEGDAVVKMALGNSIQDVLEVIDKTNAEQRVHLVKALRTLSMFDGVLDALERAGTIACVVPLLGAASNEIQNHALMCCHNMCKIKASRQEALAVAGIIPHLQRFIREDHPLKQFALPVLKAFATSSVTTRAELKKYNGLAFFLTLLDELPYWQVSAMDALLAFCADDQRSRTDFALSQSIHIPKFVRVLRRCGALDADGGGAVGRSAGLTMGLASGAEAVLSQLHQLLTRLPRLCRSLGDVPAFTEAALRILQKESAAIVRKPLLSMLLVLLERQGSDRAAFSRRHNLVASLRTIADIEEAAGMIVVADLATAVLTAAETAEKKAAAASATQWSVEDIE